MLSPHEPRLALILPPPSPRLGRTHASLATLINAAERRAASRHGARRISRIEPQPQEARRAPQAV